MPDNKNQHYVPRCHLKPFTLNREGLAINMFNHVRRIVRANVAVSGQCAKSYFYGEDLYIERELQVLEGRYARIVRDIEDSAILNLDDLEFLRNFILLQWCRTDGALRRRREIIQAMDDLSARGREHLPRDKPDLSQLSLVLGSLSVWTRAGAEISDLRIVILRNRTSEDFVTSDDPAVLTNRLFLQRMGDANFGMTNIGAMFFMPLGPRYAVVCYDHASYAPRGRSGYYIDIERRQDACAVNELQYLNTLSNIYFAGPVENGGRVQAAFEAVAGHRPAERFRTWQGVSEGLEGEFEVFRRLKDGELPPPYATSIQAFSPIYPRPPHWLSNLTIRPNIVGWVVPGSAGGPVRANRAAGIRGIQPMRIGHGPLPHRGGNFPDLMYHKLGREELARRRHALA